ncbi:MAG: hypothetical protein HC854_12565 [Flavobacterium sp.]|nr:hypothetical protein [Flavobacterium sp.]
MEYFFINTDDLTTSDSSLSLGWFKIDEIIIVNDSYCILTISLCDLLEGVISLKNDKIKNFKWILSDNGQIVFLERKKNSIVIKYKSYELRKGMDDLYQEIIDLGNQLINELENNRKEVYEEAAFIDLKRVINQLS